MLDSVEFTFTDMQMQIVAGFNFLSHCLTCLYLAIYLGGSVTLSACGQRGSLYLPPKPSPTATTTSEKQESLPSNGGQRMSPPAVGQDFGSALLSEPLPDETMPAPTQP